MSGAMVLDPGVSDAPAPGAGAAPGVTAAAPGGTASPPGLPALGAGGAPSTGGVPGADSILLDVTMPLHNTEDARRGRTARAEAMKRGSEPEPVVFLGR